MLGAIAEGDTTIHGFLSSEDCLATIDCFRKMGVSIEEARVPAERADGEERMETVLTVHGNGLHSLKDPGVTLNAMNSGTTVRLMSGILAGQSFVSQITGDDSLRSRPMGRIIKPLGLMGVMCATAAGSEKLPITIFGGQVQPVRYESPIASAQVKSCVLLAGLYADGPTFYTEPALSRNHTELMLGSFGANLKVKKKPGESAVTTILYPGTILTGQDIRVPGDISSAAYFLAAGLLVPDSYIRLKGVGINETRDGILRVIRAMGGNLVTENVRMEGREAVADIAVRTSRLKGTVIGGSLIPTLIDEIPIIAVMAAAADGTTVIRDAAELKVKETNRLEEIVTDLRLMGIGVEETDDGMIIHGGTLTGARIDPKGDHRLAMAFSVAGLAARGTTTITDERCVRISYPDFYDDLLSLS